MFFVVLLSAFDLNVRQERAQYEHIIIVTALDVDKNFTPCKDKLILCNYLEHAVRDPPSYHTLLPPDFLTDLGDS